MLSDNPCFGSILTSKTPNAVWPKTLDMDVAAIDKMKCELAFVNKVLMSPANERQDWIIGVDKVGVPSLQELPALPSLMRFSIDRQ